MLIIDPYTLLPGFTIAAFLGILLWPENIAYKNRLLLFIVILGIWVTATLLAMMVYGSSERMLVCIINLIVGFFGLAALIATYRFNPSRKL